MLDDPAAVAVVMDPIRSVILSALSEPASAVTLAERVGLSRQKVNYHLRALESHGLIEVAEERSWGGITERVMRAVATHLIVSPSVGQQSPLDPSQLTDKLSAAYQVAVAARIVTEVGALNQQTAARDQRLATLTIDTTIGFANAADRAAFTAKLQHAIADLAAQYHHDDGRLHRLVVASHPQPAARTTSRRATAPSDHLVIPPT